MTPLDVALKYLDIFFSGQDYDRLKEVLSENLKFRGPFYEFDSAQDYIDNLIADPPIHASFKIIKTFEFASSVNIIYAFSKASISTEMSQLFEIRNHKITSILLIFDTAPFKEKRG